MANCNAWMLSRYRLEVEVDVEVGVTSNCPSVTACWLALCSVSDCTTSFSFSASDASIIPCVSYAVMYHIMSQSSVVGRAEVDDAEEGENDDGNYDCDIGFGNSDCNGDDDGGDDEGDNDNDNDGDM